MYYTVERSFVNDRFARVLKSGAIVWRRTHAAATRFPDEVSARKIADRVNEGEQHSARAQRYGFES